MNHRTSVILFDLDGTLIDSIELIRSSWFHACQVHLGRDPSDAEWRKTLGKPLREQLRLMVGDPDRVEAMVTTYREHNAIHHDRLLRRYDGTVEALAALRSRVRMGIVTSKLQATARAGLAFCGFDLADFEVVIGADDVTRHKPDPEPIHAAMERLGAAPAEAWYVGDSIHDIAAGRAAGVRTAGVLWGPFPRDELDAAGPDRILARPDELLGLLS